MRFLVQAAGGYGLTPLRACLEDPEATLFESTWMSGEVIDRREQAKNPAGAGDPSGLDQAEMEALEVRHTEETFVRLLAETGMTEVDVAREHGVRAWKMSIATQMFRLTTVSLPWVVRKLNAGSVSHFSLCLRNGVRPH